MRDLTISDKNEFSLFNNASGSKILLYYSTLLTKERLQYNSDVIQVLTEARDPIAAQQVQIDWALKKITGFRKGDYSINDKPISSDVNDKDYYPGWRAVLEEIAGDDLLLFAKNLLGEPNFALKPDKGDLKSFFTKSSNSSKIGGPRKKEKTTKAPDTQKS